MPGSFGVAAFPQHGSTEKDVLRAAAATLYRAKAAGRDPVMVAEMPGKLFISHSSGRG